MIRTFAATLITAIALLALPATGQAQQAEDIGDYRVHYNAINTNAIPPEVASAYGIQRSGSRAMLNIAVLRKAESEDSMDTTARATVSARAVNLTGQVREIELREIEDDDAIYYIGTFRISNEETLTFEISVRPEGSEQPPARFSFQQQFFVEN